VKLRVISYDFLKANKCRISGFYLAALFGKLLERILARLLSLLAYAASCI
jgi:hypothetical protein